jgi:hypothetical protein
MKTCRSEEKSNKTELTLGTGNGVWSVWVVVGHVERDNGLVKGLILCSLPLVN